MTKGRKAPVEGQRTLDGKRAAAFVKGTKFIPPGRPGRPLSAQGSVNGKKQCPVCEHWFTKLHLHYSESFTFQDKSLKHLPGREFWTDWHPEPLCRVENKGTLPLPRIVDGNLIAAMCRTSRNAAEESARLLPLPGSVLAAKTGPGKSRVFVTKKCKSFFGNKETNNWLILNSMMQRS